MSNFDTIPSAYNDNKAVLMVRDPWTMFSYWEIRDDVERNTREKIRQAGLTPQKSILRLYDVTEGDSDLHSKVMSDFELRDWAQSWYLHTEDDGKKWMIDIGIICEGGEFFCMARSNVVMTPRHGMSEAYDEEWMCSKELYNKMFQAAGGPDIGKSSLDVKEMITRYLREWISSGAVSSGVSGGGSFFSFRKKK
jgi:hypothetical protein